MSALQALSFNHMEAADFQLRNRNTFCATAEGKAEVVNAALATAESSSLIAEAEVAKALGYDLCKCSFPPMIMLTVGQHNGRGTGVGPVHECPRCGSTLLGHSCTNALRRKRPAGVTGGE